MSNTCLQFKGGKTPLTGNDQATFCTASAGGRLFLYLHQPLTHPPYGVRGDA